MRTKQNGEQTPISLDDITMQVMIRSGDVVDEDVSCDSAFMLECIPKVGAALRRAFHWVPATDKIYLCMDNAGGHGTNDAIQQYTELLAADNITIIWQVPRSPETNMLDLGVWMSIQAAVQRVHHMRRCHHDALAASVDEAWRSYLNSKSFHNVWRRLRVVLVCILDDEGGNQKVESKRGKLFRDATIIDLTNEDDDDEFEIIDLSTLNDVEGDADEEICVTDIGGVVLR